MVARAEGDSSCHPPPGSPGPEAATYVSISRASQERK